MGRFHNAIETDKIACENGGYSLFEHFVGVDKLSLRVNNAKVIVKDYKLSRYACYLIAQNANPKFNMVALGQTYFVVQTRKMEIVGKRYAELSEDEKRLYRRKQTKDGNKVLYKVAKEKGVKNFDEFTNAGYKGL